MSNKKKIGQVLKLFISNKEKNKRISKNNIILDINGIFNDKFYNINKERSVLISSIQAYKLMEEKNIETSYGQLGENILIDFNPYNFKEGTQIYIGDVILQITIEGTICSFLTKINNKVPKLLKKDRGVFAKVIKGGTIHINDSIDIVN